MNLIVYSKPDCPFCVTAKEFLAERKIEFTELCLIELDDRTRLYDLLGLQGHERTMPQIILVDADNEKLRVGGCKELLLSGIESLNVPGAFQKAEELPPEVIMDVTLRRNAAETTPGFSLLPRDRYALRTIDYWISLVAEELGAEHPKIVSAQRRRAEIVAWQEIYGTKTPD